MIKFAEFNTLLLTNWLLGLSQFHFIFGVKPHCVGQPLKPEEFSEEEDVGFVRDIIVDKIARNLYDKTEYPASALCVKLANMRTSTCWRKCSKWKRSSSGTKKATKKIMTMAEALMENFIEVISKEASFNSYADEQFIVECVDDAKGRLLNSGAATIDSKIIDQLEDLKKMFCTVNQLFQHQKAFQISIGQTDDTTMRNLGYIISNQDLIHAVKEFIRNFQPKNGVKIINFHLEDNVAKTTMSGIFRLKFEYKNNKNIMGSTVILKIPSFAPSYDTWKKLNMYDREAYFYETLLPALYELGHCEKEPFAPKLYASTENAALVLEDLSVNGYESSRNESLFLDLADSQISLQVLAKYHALGYAYLPRLHPDDPHMLLIGTMQMRITSAQFDALCSVLEPSLDQLLYQKILEEKDKILDNLPMMNYDNENSMTVITHADFHKRNILFKYDNNGKILQAKLIDWQFSAIGSPVFDLIDFFVGNISIEIFEANEDVLLDSYLNSLNHNLSLLSARKYSRSELDEDMTFYKYHYFKALSTLARNLINTELIQIESYKSHMIKWMLYMQKKKFI